MILKKRIIGTSRKRDSGQRNPRKDNPCSKKRHTEQQKEEERETNRERSCFGKNKS